MKKIIVLAVLICVVGTISAQSYKVIANSENTTTTLTKKEVSDLFLKRKTKWADGTKVVPVDMKSGEVRSNFSSEVIGKSVGAVKSHWQQFVFSGKGTPPIEKKTDAEVVAYVKNNSGAIAYVSATANVSGVKVISLTD